MIAARDALVAEGTYTKVCMYPHGNPPMDLFRVLPRRFRDGAKREHEFVQGLT